MTLLMKNLIAGLASLPAEERFSPATLDHARLTFDEALAELKAITSEFEKTLRFETAVDLCLATRTAWLTAFPEWRRRGDGIHAQLSDMRVAFQKNLVSLASLERNSPLTPHQKSKVSRFVENVKWRLDMITVLLDQGSSEEDREMKVIALESFKK